MKRNSGQSAAVPLIAASTCSQMPWRLQISPILATGSIALEEVVPTVAQTKNGARPAFLSCLICEASTSCRMAKSESTSINLRLAAPIPAIRIAFSIEECAWDEVYATSFPLHPSLFVEKFVARSRAASRAQRDALDAVS